ncbi:MAG: SoxR reducing system RseC family protein [Oscillospiraceae bacterium]|nr:SoxR reducing system RseC family protein [Oscillospiraceae bacterium]
MTQNATVTRILPDGMAEVVVARTTACGGSCGSCEACVFQPELKAIARNRIQAKPGQRVVISSRNSKVFAAAFLVYIVPLLFFIAGYVAASLLGASEGVSILLSFVCLCISSFLLVRSQKKTSADRQIQFEIIS